MKRIQWQKIGFALLALALVSGITAGVIAQTGDGDEPRPSVPISGDPGQYDVPAEGDAVDAAELDGAGLVLAQAPYTMNYQGYLTNIAGAPFNGTVNIVASLFDAATVGVREWGPEAHNGVAVSNGLFQLVLGDTVALLPNDFDEALFLELTVGGTVMPRQPLRASAYAFGLVPGAEVAGVPSGSSYALTVQNTDTTATSRGLYATGTQYGLYASETGTGDVGIYTPDYIQAMGYRSNADSYLFVPGIAGKPWDNPANSALVIDAQSTGTMLIRSPQRNRHALVLCAHPGSGGALWPERDRRGDGGVLQGVECRQLYHRGVAGEGHRRRHGCHTGERQRQPDQHDRRHVRLYADRRHAGRDVGLPDGAL